MLNFEERKRDHIAISLSPQSQTLGHTGLDHIELIHEALPEINFSDINLTTKALGREFAAPLFVASMTLGHSSSQMSSANINQTIASVCEQKNWLMGVGSQRRQLDDGTAFQECHDLRKRYPRLGLMGNIGLSQLIQTSVEQIKNLVDSLEAQAMIVHTNPLQECIQPEGTPQFRGGLEALENLCKKLSVPVVLKETGCGFSEKTLRKLTSVGLAAIDVSGKGGTHWGRVEAARLDSKDVRYGAGQAFANWGLSTVDSLSAAQKVMEPTIGFGRAKGRPQIWASGGVRSGLDAAKLLAMGADMVGLAQPILEAALRGHEALSFYLESLEYELKTAMFCMGLSQVTDFKQNGLWKWK
jgi:isopentenyl-diphosphate Delta-isomerase